MSKQLAIPVEPEVKRDFNYAEAEKEYNECLGLKYLEPIFLCQNTVTKKYFVSKIFNRETIEGGFRKTKIIK